jgi:hypothetical protein
VRVPGLALILVLLAVLAGCGDASEETTTAPGVQAAFERSSACKRPAGASRWGCSVGSYRCQGVVSGRGWSISCAKPGRSLGFTIRRG